MSITPALLLASLTWVTISADLLASPGEVTADVVVTVLDREGAPVPDVAVYWQSPDIQSGSAPNGMTTVMDQRNTRFIPHLLVVQTGTSVEFPNSDVIAHHVYSFSHPNNFKLPIYKGEVYPPITFTESGIVVLGCNIHDNMLGYILVVDTPVFAKTNASGTAILKVEKAESSKIALWSPRIRDDTNKLSVAINAADNPGSITFRLVKSLRPAHDEEVKALSWSEY